MNSRPNSTMIARYAALVLICSVSVCTAAQAPVDPTREMQARINLADRARQSGDPQQITAANRRIIAYALWQMADLRASEMKFPVAIELYKRSLEYEDNPGIHLPLAIAYASVGDIDNALRESQPAVAFDPKSATAWNLRGRMFSRKKEYQSAIECYEKSILLHDDIEVSYALASAYLALRENDKAAAVFKKMELNTPNRASVHVMAGRAYEGAGMSAEAEREYKSAISIDPKASRGHYFLGLFYLVKNSWEPSAEAKREFEAEVALNPKDFFGNYFLGYLASTEKRYAESDAHLKIAAAAKPDWPEPYLYLGLNAYGAGSDANAEVLLRKAIKLTGTDDARNNYQIRRAYFTLGRILIRFGKREEGTALVKKSRDMETKLLADARQNQALSSREMAPEAPGDSATAPRESLPSFDGDLSAPLTKEDLGKLNFTPAQLKQANESEKQLRAILGFAFNDLGTSEARRKEYALALAHFRDAERWSAVTPGLARNIGMAAFLSGDFAESARALKQVVASDPSDQRSQAMLAMSLYSIKDYAAAVKVFDQVGENALNDPRMSYGWAASLARTNNRPAAIKVLNQLTAQPLPSEMLVLACQLYDEMQEKSSAQGCFAKAKAQDPTVKTPN